ncbi:MAG: penicillin-binding protein 1A [Deferribacterales bacterium]
MNLDFLKIDLKSMTKKQIIIAAVLAAFGVMVLFALLLALYFFVLSRELPSTAELKHYKYKRPTLIYDRNGEQIAELGEERRYPVPMTQIPENLQNAVVAVEDARFYEHGGVDTMGIMRAFVTNMKAGRVVEGGSTLTQQLVKILYLTPEKKLKRKVKEAILAYRIDKTLTKKEILEMYLNQVYFGRGAYGVQAAAINYFGKDVSELTLGECAMIAGIPKAPGIYAPHLSLEKSTKRRNHVLYRMLETGYITEQQEKEAAAEVPTVVDKIPPKNLLAGYFVDYIKKYLAETEKMTDIDNSGMQIYTTLDLKMQDKAEKAVKENLLDVSDTLGYFDPVAKYLPDNGELDTQLKMDKSYLADLGFEKAVVTKVTPSKASVTTLTGNHELRIEDNRWAKPYNGKSYSLTDFNSILHTNDIIYVRRLKSGNFKLVQDPPVEGSLLSVAPETGAIYAMVGGFDYRKSMFNRAYQAKRQPGSLFKPIVYSTALENGMTIMSQVLDAPMVKQLDEDKVWKPENASGKFFGYTTLKDGLTHSRNLVTLKLAEQVGIGKIIGMARKFGLEGQLNRELTTAIGSGSATLQEMVYAFSVFPNLGSRPSPYFITKIVFFDGTEKEYEPEKLENVISENTAQIMVDTMINVVDNGTGRRALAIPRTVAGKTGTTNDSKDTWFIGYMSDLVSGVWVGFDDYRPLTRGAAGSSTALPAWVRYTSGVYGRFGHKMFPIAKDVSYFRVDKETKQITDGYSDDFTFEPYNRPMSITEE